MFVETMMGDEGRMGESYLELAPELDALAVLGGSGGATRSFLSREALFPFWASRVN